MKRKLLSCLISSVLCQYAYAENDDVAEKKRVSRGFDVSTLKARGLSAEVAEFFKEEKRFLPGEQQVQLLVNGVKIGRVRAQFDRAGALCFDQSLLDQARIGLPGSHRKIDSTDCIDLKAAYPQTIIYLHPGREQVELIVPQEALRADTGGAVPDGYVTGGTAGLLNYDLLYMKNSYSGGNSSTLQVTTEAGVNVGDWILRSRQNYANTDRGQQFTHVNAYAQKTLVEHKSVLQVGQISANGSLFDTPLLLGAQLFPESVLLRPAGNRVIVDGIAQTEARVEVRQHGLLLYSTIVPPGPFSLTDINLNNANVDLHVTVFEATGVESSFIVPASSFAVGFVPKETSFSIAMGKPLGYGGNSDEGRGNWLLTAMGDLPLGSRANMTAGGMLANGYYAAGTQFTGAPNRYIDLGVSTLTSHASAEGVSGLQMTVNAGTRITDALALSGSYSNRTAGFRSFSDTQYRMTDFPEGGDADDITYRSQQQASLNLSYNHRILGGMSMGYSQNKGFVGENTRRVSLRWSKTMKLASISLSADRRMGNAKDTSVFAALNIPFGNKNVIASASRVGQTQRAGASLSGTANEFVSYRLATETNNQNQQIGSSASVSVLPMYAQSNFNVSRYGANSSSFSGKISGGAVLHDQGVTLSPYAVRDTFTMLSVGKKLPGIKIQTPQGPVWTDAAGRAVAPAMPAYTNGRLQLDSKSLPKNADIKNALFVVGMGRGAVNNIDFEVSQQRRVLLKLLNEAGALLAKGDGVFNQEGQWLSSVSNKGEIFLNADLLQTPLTITTPGGASCTVSVALPEQVDSNVFYENAEAVCRPANAG